MHAAIIMVLAVGTTAAAGDIRDADDHMVQNCEYLQDVQGKSGWGGAFGTGAGINGAKKSARKQAAKLGATHIVWGQITPSGMTYIQGRAYRCAPANDEPDATERTDDED